MKNVLDIILVAFLCDFKRYTLKENFVKEKIGVLNYDLIHEINKIVRAGKFDIL